MKEYRPISNTYSLDLMDREFLAFCSTGSMLTPRRFSSLTASNTSSTNIDMSPIDASSGRGSPELAMKALPIVNRPGLSRELLSHTDNETMLVSRKAGQLPRSMGGG